MSSFRFNNEGGIERASYEVARRLATSVDMTLVATDVSPRPEDPLTWLSVEAQTTPGFLIPVTYSAAASRALDGMHFDIVHNQGGCATRAQDVITAHSCHRAWWEMKFRNGEALRALANPLHHAVLSIEKRNYAPGAFEQIIAVSNGVGLEVIEHYGVPADRVTVIPNAVDSARFQPTDAAARRHLIRVRHDIPDEDIVLLWVGKEFRRKGLAPLIEALPHLPSHARVLVVGGDDQTPYRTLAARLGVGDRVTFAGHSTAVEDYFQAADIFVLPTLYEAFALVTLEAASAGLPIVATKVNGTEDFIVDGENGAFIERDSVSIARVLAPLVADPALCRRIGDQARKDASAYTWDAVAQRTLEVYEEVAARKRSRSRR
ncbi:glycosyltransferase family 4 protein [Microbacterium aoyamense]|nr:glycosyltransferase family 4 protein [Microbacterium aoyamense]